MKNITGYLNQEPSPPSLILLARHQPYGLYDKGLCTLDCPQGVNRSLSIWLVSATHITHPDSF